MKSKFTQADHDSLNELKKSINLVDLACHKFGYIPDWKYPLIVRDGKTEKKTIKSSANSIRLLHKDNPMDAIIISKNPANQHFNYKSLANSDDKGTIIDFVKYRHKDFTFPKFRKFCKNFQSALDKGIYPPIDTQKIYGTFGSNGEVRPNPTVSNLEKLHDTGYLLKRGFDEKNVGTYFKYAYNLLENNGSTSLVLPFFKTELTPDEGVKLYTQTYQKYSDVNAQKKQFVVGSKDTAVWVGSFDKLKPQTALIVSENPLDAASMCLLKPSACGGNPVPTASGGDFPYAIKDTYSNLHRLAGYPPFILANDNDCKGAQFNAKLLCSMPIDHLVDEDFLEKNKVLKNIDVNSGTSDFKGFLKWDFSHALSDKSVEKLTEILPVFASVRDHYMQQNYDLNKLYNKGDTFKIVTDFNEHKSSIHLEFQNVKENWDIINESLLYLRFGDSEKITIEKSICKDFNDDLKVIKGLDYKPFIEEPFLIKEFVQQGYLDEKKGSQLLQEFDNKKESKSLKI